MFRTPSISPDYSGACRQPGGMLSILLHAAPATFKLKNFHLILKK